jgi:hypothetical protein
MIDLASAKSLLAGVATTALLGGCGFNGVTTAETKTETVSFDLDDSKSVRVDLRMGSGALRVAHGTAKLMDATFSYNVAEWKPVVNYRAGGTSTGELTLSQPSSSGSSFGDAINNWNVKLNDAVAVDVTATLGAGEATLDLGKLNLSRVDMSIGAGKVDMDLRGDPKRDYMVQIRGGVGETTVQLPKDVAISATATKGIGDISIEGLEERNGVWVNPDRIGAPVTVRLDIKGGIGQITVKR